MSASNADLAFTGSVPELYEQYLVPLIFEPYALDIARRVAAHSPKRVLEIAAGTGVVTRQLAKRIDGEIVATDLNPAMLAQASSIGTARPVRWQQADAMRLPFEDGEFDAVVCQFGAMFFPDRAKAFAETRRVLRPGGVFAFNVWDSIETNEFALAVTDAMARIFPGDPPRFLARTPHGYYDTDRVLADVSQGGFGAAVDLETIAYRSRAPSVQEPATAYCHGTPLRGEIESRDPSALDSATEAAAEEIGRRFGRGPVDGRIQAHVVTAMR